MEILSLVIVLVGLVGNSMVLWLLGFRIPRNPFSVYILNLAEADVLFLCNFFFLLIPRSVGYYIHADIYYVLMNATFFFYCVGLSLLAAISTGHCLAILFPDWHLHHHPKNTSIIVCLVLWALPGLFWGLDFVLCDCVRSRFFCLKFCCLPVVWLVHFTPVMCVSSLTLLLRVQCNSQSRQPPRLYLLVLLIVFMLLLCGLPRGIQDGILDFPSDFMPHWLPTLLVCLNSSTHPFIYFLLGSRRSERGREPLRVILQRALADEQELEDERRDSSLTNTQETPL
ncbi:mas-related G-protein coupled receptor member X4-like [Notamacropus eugenii]|uniref:mas-related G-protein coupled receptor member X4-like n=1 Tax=Notamacropus eugenii TaxID=9315 RepID=UPI003B675AC4